MTEKKYAELLKKSEKYQRLTKEEEFELAGKISSGDRMALARLVESNMWMVDWILNSDFHSYKMNEELWKDMTGSGCLGLTEAALKFDASFNAKMSTFAPVYVRSAVVKCINSRKFIHIPEKKQSDIFKMKRIECELEKKGIKPSLKELALEMGLSESRVKELKRAEYINSPAAWDFIDCDYPENEKIFISFGSDFTEDVENRMIFEQIIPFISMFSERKQRAIILYLGLEGEEPHSKVEVAKILGITKQGAGQLIKSGLEELREKLCA